VSEPIDDLRAVAATATPPPEAMAAYLAKVRERAYTITDADVAQLQAAGLTEDEIFEHTVATAIGQGLRRLDRALEVIG
jgi:alkylhydroperoxidase family enzyme